MASLRQEHRYGLCCGNNDRNVPGRTLYHVKLTDTAIRALEAYQNLKVSPPRSETNPVLHLSKLSPPLSLRFRCRTELNCCPAPCLASPVD